MAYKALVVWGGWDGHQPKEVGEILSGVLQEKGFEVEVSNTLDSFLDVARLKTLNLIVPVWTMGQISGAQQNAVTEAVRSGVGIGGCHGGMCDSFREGTEWQFMTGGQWVAHPGNDGVEYTVKVTAPDDFIMQGTRDFQVKSEQYYMHTDPSNRVLATTRFPTPGADGPHVPNGPFDMPVVWTRYYGEGRVFYCSLGHNAAVVAQPEVLNIMTRGLLWAARAESLA
jgi:type 1 glutamine amidotransferase